MPKKKVAKRAKMTPEDALNHLVMGVEGLGWGIDVTQKDAISGLIIGEKAFIASIVKVLNKAKWTPPTPGKWNELEKK